MNYRLAIVEDMSRQMLALSAELMATGKAEIVLTASNGDDFLRKLKELPTEKHPQVVLMDIDMPVMNGIEAVRKATVLYPAIRYIMLTVSDDEDKLFDAINAGADGYLLKEERADTILAAVRDVLVKQGAPMSPRIARKTMNLLMNTAITSPPDKEPSAAVLSGREREILKNLVDGLDYKEIAKELYISPNTVRNHIANIYDKLHITSKAQAIKLAIHNRWF